MGVASITADKSEAGGGTKLSAQVYLVRLGSSSQPLVASARHALEGVDIVCFGRGPLGTDRRGKAGGITLSLTEPDSQISTAHARMRRALGRWLIEDLESKNGTLVGGAPVRSVALEDGDLIELGRTFYLFRDILQPARELADDGEVIAGLATLSPPLAWELRALATVARSMVPVVILGETGTGKELVARAVHAQSGRQGPFVPVNCGGIPDALVASELFGVRRGAYSDATEDRLGLVRSAHKGTLFLDEIGDLKLKLQPAFLRVLQEHEVAPVGQAKAVPVDVRVISATHRQLDELAAGGSFREDLWARLSGFTTRLPPLRARREDLGTLIAAIVRRYSRKPEQVTFVTDAFRALLLCAWPRNIRELEKRLEAALALAKDGPIERHHLGDLAPLSPPSVVTWSPADDERRANLVRLLGEHRGNVAAVARELGKDRVQVRRWLVRYGLKPDTFKR